MSATKPDQRRKRADGVRSIDDLRGRCHIDEITGCWLWRGGFSNANDYSPTPTCQARIGGAEKPRIIAAPRAAWLMSGRLLAAGQIVWRSRCSEAACINPAHCKAGTQREMMAEIKASGRLRGNPERAAMNMRSVLKMATPVEVVQRCEAMFKAGMLQKDVRAETGLRPETLRAIRLGTHINSTTKQRLVTQASVFSWGRAA